MRGRLGRWGLAAVLVLLTACAAPEPLGGTAGPDPALPLLGPGPVVAAPDRPPFYDHWGGPALQPPAAGDELFVEGVVSRFDLSLDAEAQSSLASDPKTDVEGTFTYAGRSWTVGVHLKGSYSFRPLSGKASFKIDFGELIPDQRFLGLRRLTLNSMVQDRSMIREHVAYRAYAWLGVPAPRHGYAELWVNDEPYGLYGVVETLDGTWAERVFPADDEGPIYEGGYGVDLEDDDAWDFALQRQGDLTQPWTDLEALIAELEATPPDEFLGLLDRRFDTRALFRMWAMDLVSGHRDGYVGRKNNFLLYHGLEADRWWMIPWGQDQALRDGMDVHGHYAGRLAQDCADLPACQARLDAAMRYVAEVWELWDLHGFAAATGNSIAAACERDPRREHPCGYESVLDMIAERPAEVRAELDE